MAIRYDKDYNAKINRVVRNFNQKRNRAIKRGFKNVPAPIKVSDLKARYTSRSEMNKQLTQLLRFSKGRDDALRKVENEGGATAIKWEFDYLKSNLKGAKEYFNREYKIVSSKVGDFPGERMRLDNIAKKLSILDLDLAYMNQSQFNSYRSAIYEYINKPKNYGAAYRGFLSEVENVMTLVGIPEKSKKLFFDKFSVLTPEQFNTLYQTSDLISRIYDLADSPKYTGRVQINTSKEDTIDLISTLMDETDDLVKKAQTESTFNTRDLADFERRVEKTKIPSAMKENKIPLSTLTEQDIKNLKALGWDDLIDETK